MNVLTLLKGKKVRVVTDMRTEVELIIDSVTEKPHSEDLEPATKENDWWPNTREWKTYEVKFTNGAVKSYRNLDEINIIE